MLVGTIPVVSLRSTEVASLHSYPLPPLVAEVLLHVHPLVCNNSCCMLSVVNTATRGGIKATSCIVVGLCKRLSDRMIMMMVERSETVCVMDGWMDGY
jgi:hypothetical protein